MGNYKLSFRNAFAMFSNVNGTGNNALGQGALYSNVHGAANTAIGHNALATNDSTGSGAGNNNTAVGAAALLSNTDGAFNTAVGFEALSSNTTPDGNAAFGSAALQSNTTGGTLGNISGVDVGPNTAVGAQALSSNTTSGANTAVGFQALGTITTGDSGIGANTAVGFQALAASTAKNNTAVGYQALSSNTTGTYDHAFGVSALHFLQSADGNNAFGAYALYNNTAGDFNNAFGANALEHCTGTQNTAFGDSAGFNLITGDGNVYIGANMSGLATETNQTYIRNINTTSVSGAGSDTVTVNLPTGLIDHLSSSRRHKEDIHPMANASETLYRLKPVTYRYKKEIDPTQSLDYGLVAEEVADIDPNLTARNRDGQIESVRYTAINAMLLNEFLKEHQAFVQEQQKVSTLETTIAQQQKNFEAAVTELKGQIQQMNAQLATMTASSRGLELSKAVPQTVSVSAVALRETGNNQ